MNDVGADDDELEAGGRPRLPAIPRFFRRARFDGEISAQVFRTESSTSLFWKLLLSKGMKQWTVLCKMI